jgi:hypothetical protein
MAAALTMAFAMAVLSPENHSRFQAQVVARPPLETANAVDSPAELSKLILGTWTRTTNDCRIKIEIKPQILHCSIMADQGCEFKVHADYLTGRDGILFGTIRSKRFGTGRGADGGDPRDRMFICRVTVTRDSLTLSNLQGGDVNNLADLKQHVEGKYHRVGSRKEAVGDAARNRIQELMKQSDEDLRRIQDKWERIWFINQPSHLTPERVDRGVKVVK